MYPRPVSCRDLWFDELTHDEGWPPLMLRGYLRPEGRLVVTDRHLALYAEVLDGCSEMPAPQLMTREQAWRVTALLCMPAVPGGYSPHLFQSRYLDPLEHAGYSVRPMMRPAVYAHSILAPDGERVGVLMPYIPDEQGVALACRRVAV